MKPDSTPNDIEPEYANMRSRRRFVGSVASGIVAASAMPVFGQQRSAASNSRQAPDQAIKRNPVTQYPKPPFPRQQQEWPGLAGKMIPRPDHGETSYEGSGRLTGRKALITGGDSGIGRGAAIAYAREGADVAINYLPAEEPDAIEVVQLIREAGRKAVALPGDIRDENFCRQLVADAVRELGGLDILVNNAARQHSVDSIIDLTTSNSMRLSRRIFTRCFGSLKPRCRISAPVRASSIPHPFRLTMLPRICSTTRRPKRRSWHSLNPSPSSWVRKAFASMQSRPDRSGRRFRSAAGSRQVR